MRALHELVTHRRHETFHPDPVRELSLMNLVERNFSPVDMDFPKDNPEDFLQIGDILQIGLDGKEGPVCCAWMVTGLKPQTSGLTPQLHFLYGLENCGLFRPEDQVLHNYKHPWELKTQPKIIEMVQKPALFPIASRKFVNADVSLLRLVNMDFSMMQADYAETMDYAAIAHQAAMVWASVGILAGGVGMIFTPDPGFLKSMSIGADISFITFSLGLLRMKNILEKQADETKSLIIQTLGDISPKLCECFFSE